MKKLAVVAVTAVSLMGCADSKVICGVEKQTYGLFNKEETRDPNVKYSVSYGNVIWATLFVTSVVAPIYFLGFSLFEPEGPTETAPACKA